MGCTNQWLVNNLTLIFRWGGGGGSNVHKFITVPVTDLQGSLPQNLGETYHIAASICPQSLVDYFRIANCQTVASLLFEHFVGREIKAD